MYNSSRIRNLELPENLFSNLGETRSRELEKKDFIPPIIENPVISNLEFPVISDFSLENDVKLTNYSNRQEYRERIDKMYEELKEITPIDNEIDELLFFNNYVEKGIVVKPKVSSLKQFWTEYRLIHNEKTTRVEPLKTINSKQVEKTEEEMDSFDKLFEALSARVIEFNKYIDELKEMKASIDKTTKKLEADKEKLENERQEFNTYKQNEESKLNKDKENLKINFSRLQTIINDLDKKLVSFDNEEL